MMHPNHNEHRQADYDQTHWKEQTFQETPKHIEFRKIPRLSRDIIITEKIDGTNGLLLVQDGRLYVGSKNRWLTSQHDDNHGFWAWADKHRIELIFGLGDGYHYGEWWGNGIQRGYGLKNGDKRFSMFNTTRWCEHDKEPKLISAPGAESKYQIVLPECVRLVPVLYQGQFTMGSIERNMALLAYLGSHAAPGYMNPEGVVIYHTAGNYFFKKTFENDDGKEQRRKKHGNEAIAPWRAAYYVAHKDSV